MSTSLRVFRLASRPASSICRTQASSLPLQSFRRCMASQPGSKDPDREPVRLLSEVDARGKRLSLKDDPKEYSKTYRTFAWLRLALGLTLMGWLVYDMATGTVIPEDQTEHLEPSTLAEKDTLAKRESGISSNSPMRFRMEAFIKEQQQNIVRELERIDGGKFVVDSWERTQGGFGISCVLQDGKVFEKAGVNISVIYGTLPRAAVQRMRVNHSAVEDADSVTFFASGLSLVAHPKNPMAPTVHMNCRYFETSPGTEKSAWWFGGGTDLTPSYLFDEDAIHFHKTLKETCDKHDKAYYPKFKKWCDEYFSVKHRGESRGVGGIFFDDLDQNEKDQENLFAYVQDCIKSFLPAYAPIIERRKDMPFTEAEKEWQQIRRGRYVEFNLVHDRGTSFGLNTPGARIESILISMPLTARWQYMHEPEAGSREERLVNVLKTPVDWV